MLKIKKILIFLLTSNFTDDNLENIKSRRNRFMTLTSLLQTNRQIIIRVIIQ